MSPFTAITIVAIAESHGQSYHACLDAVAREKKFLAMTEAVPLAQSLQFVRDNLRRDVAQFVAVDEAVRVVGWCDVLPAPAWAQTRQHCGTLGIGLLAGFRGRGLGGRLMSACLDKIRAQGRITRIELDVRVDNAPAIRLYERMGFVREGVRRQAMRVDGVDHDMLAMGLLLGDPQGRPGRNEPSPGS